MTYSAVSRLYEVTPPKSRPARRTLPADVRQIYLSLPEAISPPHARPGAEDRLYHQGPERL